MLRNGFFIDPDSPLIRYYAKIERGSVVMNVTTNRDYWWYIIDAQAVGVKRWHGMVMRQCFENDQMPEWAAVLVDCESGHITSVKGGQSIDALLRTTCDVLTGIVSGRNVDVEHLLALQRDAAAVQ